MHVLHAEKLHEDDSHEISFREDLLYSKQQIGQSAIFQLSFCNTFTKRFIIFNFVKKGFDKLFFFSNAYAYDSSGISTTSQTLPIDDFLVESRCLLAITPFNSLTLALAPSRNKVNSSLF